MNNTIKSALIRAGHTFWQTLAATAPVGIKITAEQITNADLKQIALAILAWLGTAVLAGVFSFIKSMAVGMPETTPPDVDYTWDQYQADKGKITIPANESEADNDGD